MIRSDTVTRLLYLEKLRKSPIWHRYLAEFEDIDPVFAEFSLKPKKFAQNEEKRLTNHAVCAILNKKPRLGFCPDRVPNFAESKEDDRMSRENELLDPRMPEDESTPPAHDHEIEADHGSPMETAPLKHTESDHPLERNTVQEPKKTAKSAFTGDRFDYTEGEYSDAPDEETEPVDIYAEPAELYEDADEDEILDAEEEITEETVEEAIEEAIEEVEACSLK